MANKFVKFIMKRSEGTPQKRSYPGSAQAKVAEGEVTKRETSTGIFGTKKFMRRKGNRGLREAIKRDRGKVPGHHRPYTKKERLDVVDNVLSKDKYGDVITPWEVTKEIKATRRARNRSRSPSEKIALKKRKTYLEQLRGKDNEL